MSWSWSFPGVFRTLQLRSFTRASADERLRARSSDLLSIRVALEEMAAQRPRDLASICAALGARDTDAQRRLDAVLAAVHRGTLLGFFEERRRVIMAVTPDDAPELGPDTPPPTFIDVQVLDAAAEPVAGAPYKLTLPDGRLAEGKLDAHGRVRVDDVEGETFQFLLTARPQRNATAPPANAAETDDAFADLPVIDAGDRRALGTGVKHVLRLPVDWMTISFVVDSASRLETEYPKFELRSTDGAYVRTLAARGDLVAGAQLYELRFERLQHDKRYTLVRHHDVGYARTVFDDAPFVEIVDQLRASHAHAHLALGAPADAAPSSAAA